MAVPERLVINGKVVANAEHQVSFGDVCLSCGQDVRESRCEPQAIYYVIEGFETVPGEVVSTD